MNNPKDPGGATKYGIIHKTLAAHRGVASVSPAQVKALSKEEATEIYRRSYWMQSGGDLLPVGIDFMAFDYGVNSGPAQAVKSLQRITGVTEDGIVGGQTVAAVKAFKGDLVEAYAAERLRFMRSLKRGRYSGEVGKNEYQLWYCRLVISYGVRNHLQMPPATQLKPTPEISQ